MADGALGHWSGGGSEDEKTKEGESPSTGALGLAGAEEAWVEA